MLISIPELPKNSVYDQLIVVAVLDEIRFKLDEDGYDEFSWFAREYPRCYRHHIDHATYRLKTIHQTYLKAFEYFKKEHSKKSDNCFGLSYGNIETQALYWNFETYLSAICSALDILARIVGTAYDEQVPVSFNKLCSKRNLNGIVELLRKAKDRWVNRVKDYRDCFVHYTPVDTTLSISAFEYSDGWQIRAKIPSNPNIRDILGFKSGRRHDLLRYSCTVYRHMAALDRSVGNAILKLFKANQYPKRINNLFFVGKRDRSLAEPLRSADSQ